MKHELQGKARGPISFIPALLTATLWLLPLDFAAAHHVLGRPAYSLSEDSNTPPSTQAELQIGDRVEDPPSLGCALRGVTGTENCIPDRGAEELEIAVAFHLDTRRERREVDG